VSKAGAGRPRLKLPHEIQFVIPKDVLKNVAKRSYWHLLQLEKQMKKDIGSVSVKDYGAACDRYAEMCNRLKREGYGQSLHGKVTQPRVDQLGLETDGRADPTATVGGDRQAQLGAGIPTDNPIT